MEQFCLITLWNVLYTIISKTLTNKLKVVINELIPLNQSGIFRGRTISNNITIADESLSYIQKSKSSFHLKVKIDTSKAYDRIKWDYLIEIIKMYEF